MSAPNPVGTTWSWTPAKEYMLHKGNLPLTAAYAGTHAYDGSGQLTHARILPTASDPAQSDPFEIVFQYDGVGNMTSRQWSWPNHSGSQAPLGIDFTHSYGTTTASSKNQVAEVDFAYDLNGNMTRLRDGELATSASWTPYNELASYSYGQPGDPSTVLVKFGSFLRYLANTDTEDPGIGTSWTELAFNDGDWEMGFLGVGFDTSTGDSATALISSPVNSDTVSIYTRREFVLSESGGAYPALSEIQSMFLGADYDDGFIAWINGVEVYRSPEMPDGAPAWNTKPTEHESSNGWTPDYGVMHDVSVIGIPALRIGVNELAIGIWRSAEDSTDLVLVPWLSINGVPLEGTTNNHRVAERYRYDASGFRLVRFPEAADGRFVVTVRDAAGQPVSEFEMDPSRSGPRLTKDFIYGETGLLVERESLGYVNSVAASTPLEVDGEYSFDIDDLSGASTYTVDIRTESGYTNQLTGADGSAGSVLIPESAFLLGETNYVRVKPEGVGPALYSAPVSLMIDPTVTSQSTNQVRAVSVCRIGTDLYIRFALLEDNGLSTHIHFERGDTGERLQLTTAPLARGMTSFQVSEQSLAAPCGQMVTEQDGVFSGGAFLPTQLVDLQDEQPDCDQPDPPDPEYLFVDSYHHRDHLGSLRAVTDSGGWLVSAHDYYPFGMEMFDPLDGPQGSSRVRYTGHERDELTAADYMKARYKLASMVSFSRPDSAYDVSFSRPASWNKYSYVRNNPLRFTDPTGNDTWMDIWYDGDYWAYYYLSDWYIYPSFTLGSGGGYFDYLLGLPWIPGHQSAGVTRPGSGVVGSGSASAGSGTQTAARDLSPPEPDRRYETSYWKSLQQASQPCSAPAANIGAAGTWTGSLFAKNALPLPPGCVADPWQRCDFVYRERTERVWKHTRGDQVQIPGFDIPINCVCHYGLTEILVGERFVEWQRIIRCRHGSYPEGAFTFDRELFRKPAGKLYRPGRSATMKRNLWGHWCTNCPLTLAAE